MIVIWSLPQSQLYTFIFEILRHHDCTEFELFSILKFQYFPISEVRSVSALRSKPSMRSALYSNSF